ncbi:MAG: phosphoribosylanthranilate isomerase, partial [Chloroflexota bacterium]|nr:phosphoribosylanthranilate isomerase [Chloroflexota bacterium]
IERSGIGMVQLSGDETPDLLDHVAIPVIKAIRLPPGQSAEDAARAIDPWLDHRRPVEAIMLDAHVAGHYGGTGHRADWTIAAELAVRYPIILAGGLTPANVHDGIRQVAPFGVDVSSGVETDGIKDHQKIRDFIAACHLATASMGKP